MKNFSCKSALKETGSFAAAIVFFAVCMCACLIGAYAAEDSVQTADGELKITVENAEITAKEGISGDCEAVYSDDTVSLNIDGFAYPGAYAQIKVSVYNGGTLTATLDEHQEFDCDTDGVSVSFPQLENGEKIAPGERCDFALVVKWDGDSQDDYTVSESGNFSMKLTYSADIDESSVPDESGSEVDDSSVPDESSSEIDDSSVSDESSSEVDDSSVPDESSSDVDDSSVPDESSSDIADSSRQTDSIAATTDSSQSGDSSQAVTGTASQVTSDSNANTGVFTEINLLLALSALFAMCTAMCAFELYNAKKNGDETDR